MASMQSNQRQVNASKGPSAPVVLYIADKTDISAFHSAHLREAGCQLHTVATAEDGLAGIRQMRTDVVVIGHGLSLADRIAIEEAVRQLHPRPRLVLLYDTSISKTEQADAVLNINSEPQHLAQTIRYLLTGTD